MKAGCYFFLLSIYMFRAFYCVSYYVCVVCFFKGAIKFEFEAKVKAKVNHAGFFLSQLDA